MSSTNEWAQAGNFFSARSRADKIPHLPSGVYEYKSTQSGWGLLRVASEFAFPFKVYDARMESVNRPFEFFVKNRGGLGVWFNGIRGGGKTVIVQRLSNRLINELDMPVIVIRSPIPLDGVLSQLNQHVAIVFDEFEKTHDAPEQQALLSAIDGLSRSEHKRMFMFTTNRDSIDENFKDRPSRIRYVFSFNRIDAAVVKGLLDDLLTAETEIFRDDLNMYFDGRDVLTIDVVKQTIIEVLTFRQPPTSFSGFFNVKAATPPTFSVHFCDPETGEVTKTLSPWFKLQNVNLHGTVTGTDYAVERFLRDSRHWDVHSNSDYGNQTTVRLLEWNQKHQAWVANVKIPVSQTHLSSIAHVLGDTDTSLWISDRPEGYKSFPVVSAKTKEKKLQKLTERFYDACQGGSIYGDHKDEKGKKPKLSVFLVKFVTNTSAAPATRHVPQAVASDEQLGA